MRRLLPYLNLSVLAALCAVVGVVTVEGAPASAGRQAIVPPTSPPRLFPGNASGCNQLGQPFCMLPFPDDYYTARRTSVVTGSTGLELHVPTQALSSTGIADFDPLAYSFNDGFSPGSAVLFATPPLAAGGSRLVAGTATNPALSLSPDANVAVIDEETGAMHPTWLERESHRTAIRGTLWLLHPAEALAYGHTYLVLVRDLRDPSGRPLSPSPEMAELLSPTPPAERGLIPRWRHTQDLLSFLKADGIEPGRVFLLWDFTVGSKARITGPELAMARTLRAFVAASKASGGKLPFVVSSVSRPSGPQAPSLVVRGTFVAPRFYLDAPGPSGLYLDVDPDGAPRAVGTTTASFVCEIPRSASASHPARPGLYGHGLLGSPEEVTSDAETSFSNAYDFALCSTEWTGLSHLDYGLAISVAANLTKFPQMAARLMQSIVDYQMLGYLMTDQAGFVADPAFRAAGPGSPPLIDTSAPLVYYGNSQGGIMGAALTAVSSQIGSAVLGVGGADYDLLLFRSSDFAPFLVLLDGRYKDAVREQVLLDLVQTLWDRAEADGYLGVLGANSPLPSTPRHRILLIEALGDKQVANVATEYEARTIGAWLLSLPGAPWSRRYEPTIWGLREARGPVAGASGLALFYSPGVPAPPLSDTPPKGPDPHESPRRSLVVQRLMASFFTRGVLYDPCGRRCVVPLVK
jgi:hypothetical protein